MNGPKITKAETMEESNDVQAEEESAPVKRPWGLLIAVIAVAGVAFWLVFGDNAAPKKAVPLPAPLPTTESRPAPLPGSAPESARDSGTEQTAVAPTHPGEQGRATIARLGQGADAAGQAFAEAQRLQEEGRPDDAYLLYFFAAKQGHAEAALVLGTQADPANFDSANTVLQQADPGQAYKWYRMAADNGSKEAKRRLAALHATVKKAAATGDEQAARVMLQWQ